MPKGTPTGTPTKVKPAGRFLPLLQPDESRGSHLPFSKKGLTFLGEEVLMRAVIPVAGIGVRLKPHTYTMPKVLINVAGKPILGYILDELKKLGIKRIILIIGYMGEIIKEYVDKNYNFQVDYVYQEEREGLGQAIYLAMDYLKGEPALIILGDTVFRANLNEVLKGKYSSLGVKEVENPKRFGTVELKKKFIVKLGEKLAHPPSNLAIVGIYYIKRTSLLGKCLEELIEKKIKTK